MESEKTYQKLKEYLEKQIKLNNLEDEKVLIHGKVLTAEEAIGNPIRRDFPLMKGKEKLLQAEFKGSLGQSYTDSPSEFEGTLKEFSKMPLDNNFNIAAFIATLNAVMRYLNLADKTIHCKNNQPDECGEKLAEYIELNYGNPKIALIGLQPALLDFCSRKFEMRVVDMDKNNIDKEKYNVLIEDAENKTEEVMRWCDLLLITGSTIANGSIVNFLEVDKPTIYYGTTIAGVAEILGLNRFCECSK